MTVLQGLSESEVVARRARGQGNDVALGTSRSYADILRQNVFTFINNVLFGIGIVLIVMGQLGDAVVTAGLVLLNVIVGVVQEGRAKRTLDQIALLTRPQASVVREGQEKTVDPSELVLGDVIAVGPGDQIVVDGELLAGRIDVDESLLTGESDLIPKNPGDAVYSGSFCVTGSGYYEAKKVGADSLANQLTAGARAYRQIKTPLQRDVDLVIRVMVLLALQLGVLLAISDVIRGATLVESVKEAAVIVSLVPQGLFFMITVTYALGAVRIAGRGALVQQANAVESLSNVDVLCSDKTGTLTTNRIRFHALHPLNTPKARLEQALGDYVTNTSNLNRTAEAIAEAFQGQARTVVQEVPFSSAYKWSGLVLDDEGRRGAYVLGAPEVLQPHLHPEAGLEEQKEAWAAQGLRVLLFAYHPEVTSLHDPARPDAPPKLPDNLIPLGLLSFSDELRPEAKVTLEGFIQAGIRLKIISGDDPHTVAALAKQAGLADDVQVVSGLELAEMDEETFTQAAQEATIFGRITPEQKQRLVGVFRDQGGYVAMIGDGVNDVLSLKQADLGISMQSGSQATRSVADIVLINDSFGVLPQAFQEGQRIVNGMQDIVRLFLTRTFYVTLLILAAAMVRAPFPFMPKDNSVLAMLTVGIPTLGLAAWARSGPPNKRLLRAVRHFVFTAAFTVAVFGLAVYLLYWQATDDIEVARTALTSLTVLCGLLLVPFVEPPTPAWVGGDALSGDRRPTILALGMLILYGLIVVFARDFFELAPLQPHDWLLLGAAAAVWGFFVRFAWRTHLFERLLNFEIG